MRKMGPSSFTNDEIDELTKRIMKLPPEKIDELWLRCGFIFDRQIAGSRGYKAVYDAFIETIKRDFESARELVAMFVDESDRNEVLKNLNDLEKE